MNTFTAIQKRRSIRNFTGEPIPVEDLEKIVDAGRLAPSGNNKQPWHFIVVTNKAIIKKLSVAAEWSANASAMIVVVMNTASKYWAEDGSVAVENMLLAATTLGYGTCWLEGNALPHEDSFKELLNIPEYLKLLTLIPVGIPVEWPEEKPKKTLDAVLHWETF
ncbi:MAG: nitroreductase family protein [Brevefilum sp.]